MTKEKKLEIWKKDAADNGFTCENCKYSELDAKMNLFRCWIFDNLYFTEEYFCANFKFKQTDGQE